VRCISTTFSFFIISVATSVLILWMGYTVNTSEGEAMNKSSGIPAPDVPLMPHVTLTGRLSTAEDKLIIEYTVANTGAEAVYLWDLIKDYHGRTEFINHDIAYVFYEKPETVRVVRAMLQLPFDRDIYMKEDPYVRIVPAGGSAQGRIVLSTPVAEFSPFYPGPEKPEDEKEIDCNKIRLIIGCNQMRPGMVLKKDTVGDEEMLQIKGSWAPLQLWVETTLKAPVKLKVREDAFDRRLPMH
jgi:hypothetical protein